MRPTVNQHAQMIEEAIAKMQSAQVQLVNQLMESFIRSILAARGSLIRSFWVYPLHPTLTSICLFLQRCPKPIP